MNEAQIRQLFAQHEVSLARDDVWKVQGTSVIKHSALERLSAALRLTWYPPVLIRSERDECVVLVTASRVDGITEWSFGEALINQDGQTGGNYKVSGKQASYVYAMGEKRGKDRVIIKLAGLHGAYSEEEADDFKDRSKRDVDRQESDAVVDQMSTPSPVADPLAKQADNRSPDELAADAMKQIDGFDEHGKVTLFMTNKAVKMKLKGLGAELEKKVADHAKARYATLKAGTATAE